MTPYVTYGHGKDGGNEDPHTNLNKIPNGLQRCNLERLENIGQ